MMARARDLGAHRVVNKPIEMRDAGRWFRERPTRRNELASGTRSERKASASSLQFCRYDDAGADVFKGQRFRLR